MKSIVTVTLDSELIAQLRTEKKNISGFINDLIKSFLENSSPFSKEKEDIEKEIKIQEEKIAESNKARLKLLELEKTLSKINSDLEKKDLEYKEMIKKEGWLCISCKSKNLDFSRNRCEFCSFPRTIPKDSNPV